MREAQLVRPRYAKPVDYDYTIQQSRDGYAVSYRRQKWGWVLICVSGLAFVLPWFVLNGFAIRLLSPPITDTGVKVAFAAAWPLAAISGYLFVLFLNSRRRSRTFFVTPQFVEVDSKRYERQHIASVFVKAPSTGEIKEPIILHSNSNTGFIAAGASGALGFGGVFASGAVVGTQAAQDLGRVLGFGVLTGMNAMVRSWGWSIWLGYGDKPARLVRGLGELQAEAMANDIGRLLQS